MNDKVNVVAIQSDGKIVVTGYTYFDSTELQDFMTVRYSITGTMDTTNFNNGGIVSGMRGIAITPVGSQTDDQANAVIISGGTIVVAGYSETSVHDYSDNQNDVFIANNHFSLVRYNSNGSLDTAFDTDGKVLTDNFTGSTDDIGNGTAIQLDGKIVVAGLTINSSSINCQNTCDFAVARYTADKASTTTALTSAPNPSVISQTVTFTATVIAGTGTPTGNVTFVRTIHRLHDPMMAMLTGEIRVSGFKRIGDFDRLFPDSPFGPLVEHPP